MPRTGFFVFLIILCLTGCTGRKSLPERLVSKDADIRDAARNEWEELDEEQQFQIARDDLGSESAEVAWFCADHLDPLRLNLPELRLRGAILARHPEEYLLPDGRGEGDVLAGLGAPELADLWRGFAKLSIPDTKLYFGDDGSFSRSDTFQQTHRFMTPDHIPVLAELLEAEDPVVFAELLWTLLLASEFTDRHREEVAGAALYAIARLEAGDRGAPPPAMATFAVDSPETGLPEAFVTLAEHLWRSPARQQPLAGPIEVWLPNPAWLIRWARDLTPTARDVPFLARTARQGEWMQARVWAIRALAGIEDPEAERLVGEIADGQGRPAVHAAAALARMGEPARFLDLLSQDWPSGDCRMLALEVAPDELLGLWTGTRPEWDWSVAPSDLSEFEADTGVRISPEVFRPFLQAELKADTPPARRLGLLEAHPDLFDRKMLEKLVAGLIAGSPPGEEEGLELEACLGALAHLEVRAPDLLSRLLAWLAGSTRPETRLSALRLLARVGDAQLLEATLECMEELLTPDLFGPEATEIAADLGHLRDDRIRAFLQARARFRDRTEAFPALVSLSVHGDLDLRFVPFLAGIEPEEVPDPAWTEFRDAALARDGVGAALALYAEDLLDGSALPHLGRTRDLRAVELLGRLREERSPDYWPATAGLALAGNSTAKRELLDWVGDARTAMLDEWDDLLVVAMEIDPGVVDLEIDRLESNCCLGFHAIEALRQRFPTLDVRYQMHDFPQTRRRIEKWHHRHRGRFEWSRIVGGWVPGE
jgi:hypothetical protein